MITRDPVARKIIKAMLKQRLVLKDPIRADPWDSGRCIGEDETITSAIVAAREAEKERGSDE